MRNMVLRGASWTYSEESGSDNRDLIQFELPLEVPPYPYSIVWHRRSDQDPSMTWLRSCLAS
jgi:DNA-binding transcriptional LysR family regulator